MTASLLAATPAEATARGPTRGWAGRPQRRAGLEDSSPVAGAYRGAGMGARFSGKRRMPAGQRVCGSIGRFGMIMLACFSSKDAEEASIGQWRQLIATDISIAWSMAENIK